MNSDRYQQYAADCMRRAQTETKPEDKNLMLNMALAWVRLAHQIKDGTPEAAPQRSKEELGA